MYFDIDQVTFWNHQHFIAIALYLYCYFIGSSLLPISSSPHKNQTDNVYLHLFFSTFLGLSLLIAGLFLVGISGFLKTTPVILLMLTLFAIPVWRFYHHKSFPLLSYIPKHKSLLSILTSIEFWFLLTTLATVMLIYSGTPGHSDDTNYHLPHARAYLEKGNLSLNPHIHLPLIAQNGDILFAWSFMFGNFILAQALATLPFFLITLGMFGLSKKQTSSVVPAMLTTCLLLNSSMLQIGFGFAYIDLLAASFLFSGTFTLLESLEKEGKEKIHWQILSGILLGTAIGTKLLVAPLIFVLLVWLFFQNAKKGMVLVALTTTIFGCSWYVRSWVISGNPIHPIAPSLFGFYIWEPIDYITLANERLLLNKNNIVEAITQNLHSYIPFISLLIVLFWKKLNKVHKLFLMLWFTSFLFWFFTTHIDRYLLTGGLFFYFLVSLIIYSLLQQVPVSEIFKHYVNKTLTLGLFGLSFFFLFSAISDPRRLNPIESLLLQPATGVDFYKKANELRPIYGDRVLNLSFQRGIWFFDGEALGGFFGPERLIDFCMDKTQTPTNTPFCTIIPAQDLMKRMNQLNTRMAIINTQRFELTPEYPQYFDLLYHTKQGVLLVPKEPQLHQNLNNKSFK
jgi:hypothetical protein